MTQGSKRGRLVVVLIFALFAAPAVISWLLLSYTSIGESSGGSHGSLVSPPRPLPNMQLQNLVDPQQPETLHGKWSMLYLHEGKCLEVCADNLYKIRQIRLASGKHAPRLQRVLVQLGNEEQPLNDQQLQAFAGQLMLKTEDVENFPGISVFRLQQDDAPLQQRRIYLVDPLGNLMLAYPEKAEPKGIIKDLKRLLRYSRIG